MYMNEELIAKALLTGVKTINPIKVKLENIKAIDHSQVMSLDLNLKEIIIFETDCISNYTGTIDLMPGGPNAFKPQDMVFIDDVNIVDKDDFVIYNEYIIYNKSMVAASLKLDQAVVAYIKPEINYYASADIDQAVVAYIKPEINYYASADIDQSEIKKKIIGTRGKVRFSIEGPYAQDFVDGLEELYFFER